MKDDFDFDILDATKVWPEEDIPIRYIGELELNRNIDEFFTQVEQVRFLALHEIQNVSLIDPSGRLLHFPHCAWH
jgi:catalase